MLDEATERAAKFASLYARGVLTRQEVVTKLVLLAAEGTAASLAAAIPPDLLQSVGDACRHPPADPSESPLIFSFGVSDAETWRRESSHAWFTGAWAWHRHLGLAPSSRD